MLFLARPSALSRSGIVFSKRLKGAIRPGLLAISFTASSLSLIAGALRRGRHSHCLSSRLPPVKQQAALRLYNLVMSDYVSLNGKHYDVAGLWWHRPCHMVEAMRFASLDNSCRSLQICTAQKHAQNLVTTRRAMPGMTLQVKDNIPINIEESSEGQYTNQHN